jgi:geranylgeranyl diphosphate synthase type I
VAVFKSGKYTIERPLHLGAALAGAGDETIQTYSDYGLPLGEAFQLRDDVLGVFGDPSQTGKPAGDDLREGKRTVLVAMGLARANAAQTELLHRCLGDPLLSAEDVEQVREVLTETGALAELEAMITRLTEQSLRVLSDAGRKGTLTDEGVEALTSLVAATTARSA